MRIYSFLVLLTLSFTACSQSTAGLTLQPQEQFVLGEYMKTSFTASMRNDGPVPITVFTVDKDDQTERQRVELPVGKKVKVTVPVDQEARLFNYTNQAAEIFVRMNKKVVGMRMLDLAGEELPNDYSGETATDVSTTAAFQAKSTSAPVTEHDFDIPAGHEFIVGEATSARYSIEIKNFGGKQIEISVRNKTNGKQTQGFGLGIYGKETIHLGPDEQLHVENYEGRERRIVLKLSQAVAGARAIPIL